MDVSIIIVNYNTGKLLHDCIQSVKEKTDGLSYEVIVVDNASADDSIETVQSSHPDVKVVPCGENKGFGRGNNRGMQESTGKYYFLLNPDTLLMNNAIKIMFDFMERTENRNIAVCGGALYNARKEPAVSFGRFPTLCSMIFYSMPLSALFRGNEGLVLSAKRRPFPVDYVTGADFFIRQEVLELAGRFDEHYFAYYEESDLTKRISNLGYQSVIVPSANIMHLEGISFKNAVKRKKLKYESSLYYLSKFNKNDVLFKLYCLIHELKYNLYKILSPAVNTSLWNEMISISKQYRTKK